MKSPTQVRHAPVKVTIIVPVYNVEPYVREALESLKRQTLSDIEVLIDDDRGTDGSMIIAQEFADTDPRFRIIVNAENIGVGASRQRALEQATGDYIGFLDADDWADNDWFQSLHFKAISTGADIVRGTVIDYRGSPTPTKMLPETQLRHGIPAFAFDGVFFSAIYRRQFLIDNDVRFPDLRIAEDAVFLTRACLAANLISAADGPSMHYRATPGSLSRQVNAQVIYDRITAQLFIVRSLNKRRIPIDNYLYLFRTKTLSMVFASIKEYVEQECVDEITIDNSLRIASDVLRECSYRDSFIKKYGDLFTDLLIRGGAARDFRKLTDRTFQVRLLGLTLTVHQKAKANKQRLLLFKYIPFYTVKGRRGRIVEYLLGIPFRFRKI